MEISLRLVLVLDCTWAVQAWGRRAKLISAGAAPHTGPSPFPLTSAARVAHAPLPIANRLCMIYIHLSRPSNFLLLQFRVLAGCAAFVACTLF
jgi:hypothetical protein